MNGVKIFGVVLILLAVLVAYLMWFVLLGYLQGLIPHGDFKPLLDFIAAIFVAWIGGIGLPIVMLIFGFTMTFLSD